MIDTLSDLSQLYVERYDYDAAAPTLIFLHDSLGCTALWRTFPQALGAQLGYNVIIYDRQGYGQSCPFSYAERDEHYLALEADILIRLMDHWQLDKAILFGHSDGGSIAIMAAAAYPDRIQAIVTEGAHIFVETVTLQGIQAAIDAYTHTALKSRLEKYHGDKTDALFWAWAGTWHNPAFQDWNVTHLLPQIQCPSLIIQGTLDEYGSLAQVYQVIAQTSGISEALILPEVGHSPHKEVPDIILHQVGKFLTYYI